MNKPNNSMNKSSQRLLTFCFLVIIASSCYSQNEYYYKPWKGKQRFEKREVLFLIDTSKSSNETQFLLDLTYLMKKELEDHEISCTPTPFPSDTIIDSTTLCLLFKHEKMAYVKLKTLTADLPLCFRIGITQTQPKNKKGINTIASIDVNKQIQGKRKFAIDFARRLSKQFK